MGKPIVVSKTLMSSPFSISVYSDTVKSNGVINTEAYGRDIISSAYREIIRIENLLTEFRKSPLNDINGAAGIRPVKVTEELFDLIEFAQSVSRDSNGAFDISVAAVGLLWRKAFQTGNPPENSEIVRAKQFVDYKKIQMNRETLEIYLPLAGMRIGLGAIGKGYSVDKAYHLLKQAGCQDFCINGAGDVRVSSSVWAPRPWKIAIRNPFSKENISAGMITVSNDAVATSGDYERYFNYNGKKYHHIIDARSSSIRNDVSGVTVIADSTLLADTYATTIMTLGCEAGEEFLRCRRDVKGLIISSAGSVIRCNF